MRYARSGSAFRRDAGDFASAASLGVRWGTCRGVAGAVMGLMVALSSVPASARTESVPAWVSEAARQTIPVYAGEPSAVVLLDQTKYTVAPNGTAVESRRWVVKILRPSGREEAIVAVPFDNGTKIRSLKVWSIAPDGHEYAMKDAELTDFGYAGQGSLFEDEKVRVARAPGRDPGGVVAYEAEQTVRPFVTEKTWAYQGSIPRLSESFLLELPQGFTYGTVWAHRNRGMSPVAPQDLEHQQVRWEMKNVPAVDLERVPLAPASDALEGRMTIHYAGPGVALTTAGTWPSIGEWYERLAKDRLAPTPEIAAKARELAGGKTDFYAVTEAIGEFVQRQIRYFVIEVGIGGYQPHAASEIFRNRYGDCKDKATLVSAMLSSVGIHAALMMVDTDRGVVDPDAPSLWGNHMIAAIEIPKGYESASLRSVVTASTGRRYLIFDPTWEMTPFGQLEHGLQGGYGILIEGAASEAIQLPILAPDRNTIRRSASFELGADGTLSGEVTEKRFGDVSEAVRTMYSSGDAQERKRFLDTSLSRDFANFSVSDVAVADVMSLNKELTLSYRLTAEHFARSMGTMLMVRPRVLGTDELRLDHKPRQLPINLRQTMQNVDAYDIKLPSGYTVDDLPAPVKVETSFAAYESAVTLSHDTLHYARTYTVRQVALPAEQYRELQRLASLIEADEQNNAVVTRKP